ncbi:Serine/threonine-protein kinase CTR1 [Hordeum vulgare]|nr:Serine/threonine-protein kinase CTR1 [Hordeum vulgare]
MEADELLKKVRVLEAGQAELKREVGRLMPDRPRGAQSAARRRAFRARLSSSWQVAVRGRLSDRHCHWILQSLGQAVHVIAPDGKFLYWSRYSEHMFGYSASEAIGQDAVELIVHPADYDAAKIVIQKIFRGKCWRGKFPVKNKSGERFFILIHNSPLYDDDGSLVGLIGLSLDVRTLEEIFSPSGSAESYPSTTKSQFHANNRPKSDSLNKGSLHSQQPLRSTTTSKIVTLVTSVTSRVRSRKRTCQNSDKQYEKSPGKSCKTSSDDSGEGKLGFHKIFNAKAEALLAKKSIWPWKGHAIDGSSGKNNMNSTQLHDKQANDQNHQRVVVLEPFIIPDNQNNEYTWASKYEVSGSWWDYNMNSVSSINSTGSTNSSGIETVDYEADCLDYEILWEDLVIGEQTRLCYFDVRCIQVVAEQCIMLCGMARTWQLKYSPSRNIQKK